MLETFERYDENERCLVYGQCFGGLYVILAPRAVPFVLLIEQLRFIELLEAVSQCQCTTSFLTLTLLALLTATASPAGLIKRNCSLERREEVSLCALAPHDVKDHILLATLVSIGSVVGVI